MRDKDKDYPEEFLQALEELVEEGIIKKHKDKMAKYHVAYSKNNELFVKTINAKNEDKAEDRAIKKFKITNDDIRSVYREENEDD